MVKVGKVLDKGDSIQYVELNKVYVYPQLTFENERQRMEYNRLVYNVKKGVAHSKGGEQDYCGDLRIPPNAAR